MFLLIGNSGSNHNYIGLTLAGSQVTHRLTYHNLGTHGDINIIDISNMDYNKIEPAIQLEKPIFMVCFASKWNETLYKILKKNNVKIIQILIEKNQECLLINWQEKLRINPQDQSDVSLSKDWETQQKLIWKGYTNFPIERAVLEWTYKLYDENFVDVKKTKYTDDSFSFGNLYTSYEDTAKQFKKFNIAYSKEDYNNWRTSQKLIFDSWDLIKKNIETPKNLKVDYQKGIAIALKGIKEQLTPDNCWSKYESLLN